MDYTFKGTKAPWVLGSTEQEVSYDKGCGLDGSYTTTYINNNNGRAVCSVLGISLSSGDSGWIDISEAIPNAHIIATAPDLLQVAINALHDMQNIVPESPARNSRIEQIKGVIHRALNIQP